MLVLVCAVIIWIFQLGLSSMMTYGPKVWVQDICSLQQNKGVNSSFCLFQIYEWIVVSRQHLPVQVGVWKVYEMLHWYVTWNNVDINFLNFVRRYERKLHCEFWRFGKNTGIAMLVQTNQCSYFINFTFDFFSLPFEKTFRKVLQLKR